MKVFTVALFLSLIIISCETQPPDIVQVNADKGTLVINSDITGADVYLNNKQVGVSDLSIKLSPGSYTVFLIKDTLYSDTQSVTLNANETKSLYFVIGLKSAVLLEDFANVSCDPCVVSSAILHSLTSSHYSNQLIIIRYATNFPSPNDPFYLFNQNLNDNRISLYNVLFAPTTIVDGIVKPIATDSLSIIGAIDSRLAERSSYKITDLQHSFTADSISVSGRIFFPQNNMENVALHILLSRKEVQFQSPPGSNGETIFYDVAFASIPNDNGVILSALSNGNNQGEFSFSIANTFNFDNQNLEAVLFIQNKINNEVYFAIKTK